MNERLNQAYQLLGLDPSEGVGAEAVKARRAELLTYYAAAPAPAANAAKTEAQRVREAAELILTQTESAPTKPEEPNESVTVTTADPAAALAELDEDDGEVYATATVQTPTTKPDRDVTSDAAQPTSTRMRSTLTSTLGVLVGIALVACLILGVYAWGRSSEPEMPPHPDQVTGQNSASERAQRLVELRDAVAKDPTDYDARLSLGVVLFESGDSQGAKEQWDAVVAAQPENARAHFNLGFWYLAQDPAQTAEANAAWDRVLELEPDSEMARIISFHRDGHARLPGFTQTPGGADQ